METTRCYKFRIDPTREQEHSFIHFAGCRRFVWNWALSRKREVYKATGKGIGYNALAAELVALIRAAPFLKDCHSQVLQQTLMDMDKAFKAFFEERARFPRLKSRKRSPHAFRIPQNVCVVGGRVSIPKVGLVKARIHRSMAGTIKSATIKQETDTGISSSSATWNYLMCRRPVTSPAELTLACRRSSPWTTAQR